MFINNSVMNNAGYNYYTYAKIKSVRDRNNPYYSCFQLRARLPTELYSMCRKSQITDEIYNVSLQNEFHLMIVKSEVYNLSFI